MKLLKDISVLCKDPSIYRQADEIVLMLDKD